MDEFLDLVGVVDDADPPAPTTQAFHLPYLEGSWFLAGGFEFDEADLALGEDYESVWHACVVGAGEFWGYSAGFADFADEGFFDFSFEHCFSFFRSWWNKRNNVFT